MSEIPHLPKSSSSEPQPGMVTMPTPEEFEAMARVRRAREAEQNAMRSAELSDWAKAEKRRKWKGRMRKVMAATALLATVKSGGLIDMAADPFSDAGSVAAGAIEVEPVDIPDEMDGIAFQDYPAETQAEHIADEEDRVERATEAKKTVVDLFERADDEGYDGIVAEVRADRAEHPELYVSADIVESTKEAIDAAESNADALEALGGFMKEYSLTTGFGDDRPFDGNQGSVKQALEAYVDVFSVLPKDFVALAELTHVTVSDKAVTSLDGVGSEAGSYSPDEGSINVVTRGSGYGAMMKAESVLQGDDYTYQSVVAHELGHALSEHQPVGSFLKDGGEVDMSESTDPKEIFGQLLLNHVNHPSYMSVYGRSTSEENTAEVLSGVLSDRGNGLATTDEWRRFTSGANKSMIDMLAQLEEVRPGIAKILVANRVS